MMDAKQHLAKPNRIYEDETVRVEFKPIYQHPYNGWEIVKVSSMPADELVRGGPWPIGTVSR